MKGWLYVDSNSATFVSDKSDLIIGNYAWPMLSDRSLLEDFLAIFEPKKHSKNPDYEGYYVELDIEILKIWFEALAYGNDF